MNQILFTGSKISKKNNRNIRKFKFLLFLSLVIAIGLFYYFVYSYNFSNSNKNVSDSILNSFNIQRLYSNNDNYTTITLNSNGNFFVIGSIEIPSININYPILSNTNDELLKIAPCRFFGPYPNEIGNLCIAAHNYDDNRFFSNLHNIEIGNKINIYDSKNSMICYYVYDKYEIDKNDTSCTSQDTHEKREITLVTCNNINGNRLIIKAIEQ